LAEAVSPFIEEAARLEMRVAILEESRFERPAGLSFSSVRVSGLKYSPVTAHRAQPPRFAAAYGNLKNGAWRIEILQPFF
jgi:hypothetical protein